MIDSFNIRRLADKSAFVVFNRVNWKTVIVLQSHIESRLKERNFTDTSKSFATLTKVEQIEKLVALDLLEIT